VTKLATNYVWTAEEALDALAEIGPMLKEVEVEVAWHDPAHWRGTGPELVLTVWPRSTEELPGDREVLPTRSR
jgi:hypothetical protein